MQDLDSSKCSLGSGVSTIGEGCDGVRGVTADSSEVDTIVDAVGGCEPREAFSGECKKTIFP